MLDFLVITFTFGLFFVGLYKLVRGVAAQPDGDFILGAGLIVLAFWIFAHGVGAT